MNARRTALTLTLALGGLAAPICAQPTTTAPPATPVAEMPKATQLVKTVVDAMGGPAAVAQLKSVAYTVKIEDQMNKGAPATTATVKSARDGKLRLSLATPQGTVQGGQLGKVLWANNPAMNGYSLVPAAQRMQMTIADPLGRMLALVDGSHELKTVGTMNVGADECHKVEVREKGAKDPSWFALIDAVGLRGFADAPPGMGVAIVTSVEGFKAVPKKVTGDPAVMLPTSASMAFGTMVVAKMNITVESLNTASEADFALPEEVKALVAEKKAAESAPPSTPGG